MTENEDPELRDPATDTRNYNEPGAARLKMTVRWIKESDKLPEEDFYPIHTFVLGQLFVKAVTVSPESDTAKVMVQRYDYDSNGNYIIRGLDVIYLREDADNYQHLLAMCSGLAHVNGVEIKEDAQQIFPIGWAMDTKYVGNEPVTFTADGWYTLRHNPIAALHEVNGIKQISVSMTHGGSSGCKDRVPKTPLVSIVSITQGATTYTSPADFIMNGDDIDWSPGGAEPAPGSTYNATIRYQSILTPIINAGKTAIQLIGLVPGTVCNVDYDYYLPRYDRVVS